MMTFLEFSEEIANTTDGVALPAFKKDDKRKKYSIERMFKQNHGRKIIKEKDVKKDK